MSSNYFIVGYPKTGNTWLTRMVARSISSTVKTLESQEHHKEIASDLNSEIEKPSGDTVYKQHKTPEQLLEQRECSENDRIIVISRDPLDCFISCFFYFEAPKKGRYTNLSVPLSKFLNPHFLLSRLYYRRKLNRYIERFCREGYNDNWSMQTFYSIWEQQDKFKSIAFTTYESLMNNAERELNRIFDVLGVSVGQPDIADAVANESFDKRKSEVLTDSSKNKTMPELQKRFMRKAVVGDHKNHLTEAQISRFIKLFEKNS